MRRRGIADDAIERPCPLTQGGNFAPQLIGFERAFRDEHQPVGLEGLLDEVISADFDGADRSFDIAVAGDHDHGQALVLLLHLFEHLEPVEPRPLQPDIEKYEVRSAAGDGGERFVGVLGGSDPMPLVFQNSGDELSDVLFIVDNQNIGGHYTPLCPASLACAGALSAPTLAARDSSFEDVSAASGTMSLTQAPRPDGASSNSSRPP